MVSCFARAFRDVQMDTPDDQLNGLRTIEHYTHEHYTH
jgi:hypothetical protein